jgi:hypothetical protein
VPLSAHTAPGLHLAPFRASTTSNTSTTTFASNVHSSTDCRRCAMAPSRRTPRAPDWGSPLSERADRWAVV